eukprot:8888330-Alexandrium_andersonii.AAC.1
MLTLGTARQVLVGSRLSRPLDSWWHQEMKEDRHKGSLTKAANGAPVQEWPRTQDLAVLAPIHRSLAYPGKWARQ